MKDAFLIPRGMRFRHLVGRYPALAVSSLLLYGAGWTARQTALFVRTELCFGYAAGRTCGGIVWTALEAVILIFLFCLIMFGAVSLAGQAAEGKNGVHPGWMLDGFSSGACFARSLETGIFLLARLLLYTGLIRVLSEAVRYFAADRTAGMLLLLDSFMILALAAGYLQKYMPVIWLLTEDPERSMREALRLSRRMTDGRRSEILFYRIFPMTFSILAYVLSPVLFCAAFPVLLATDAVLFQMLKNRMRNRKSREEFGRAANCGKDEAE